MYYHASQTQGIEILEPRVSNHGEPLVYLSDRRENVLVYLSNAVERFCRERGIDPQGPYSKWGSYGFGPDGRLCLDEYWPNATEATYGGVAGYIYTSPGNGLLRPLADVPHAFVSGSPVPAAGCEFVPDALKALREAEAEGKIVLKRYEENSEKMLQFIAKGVQQEYADPQSPEHYRAFLREKFPYLR